MALGCDRLLPNVTANRRLVTARGPRSQALCSETGSAEVLLPNESIGQSTFALSKSKSSPRLSFKFGLDASIFWISWTPDSLSDHRCSARSESRLSFVADPLDKVPGSRHSAESKTESGIPGASQREIVQLLDCRDNTMLVRYCLRAAGIHCRRFRCCHETLSEVGQSGECEGSRHAGCSDVVDDITLRLLPPDQPPSLPSRGVQPSRFTTATQPGFWTPPYLAIRGNQAKSFSSGPFPARYYRVGPRRAQTEPTPPCRPISASHPSNCRVR